MSQARRLPDFVVIGAMKAGTTSLHAWLGRQPEVFFPSIKEPNFFSRDQMWRRGVGWYAGLFAPAADHQLAGEASVSYTSPDRADLAADRMAGLIPGVKLLYLVRDPIERIRSHYRHQVQRGRERRPFEEALRDPSSAYLRQSHYYTCLRPYVERFPREQICVVRMEDLAGDPPAAWLSVLRHLDLSIRPAPSGVYNVTSEKAGFTRPMLWLWDSGIYRALRRMPGPARSLAKRLLLRRDGDYEHLLKEATLPVPAELEDSVWRDVRSLEDWLQRDRPLWDRDEGQQPGAVASND